MIIFLSFFLFLAQVQKFDCKKEPKYHQLGQAIATQVQSRNDAHLWFIHPSDNQVTPCHNKVFDPQVESYWLRMS